MHVKKIISVLALIFILSAGWIGYAFLYPRSYSVAALKKREGTKYWMLSTGSRIAYMLVAAKGNKKPFPVIYLHGGPGAGITDLEITTIGRLSDFGYDVYLYDQVGCGHSSRLKNISGYTTMRHKKDLEEIVEYIHAEKVILLGQSWGAILSLLFLASHPLKVEKLVITAPAPVQPENKKYALIKPPDSLQLRAPFYSGRQANIVAANLRAKAMEECLRRFEMKLAGDREADQYATFLTGYLNKSMVCDTAHAVIAEGTEGYYVHYMTRLSLGKVTDPRPALKNCNVPVLIMKAQCDNQPWGYTQEYIELFRNHNFVLIKNAGHNIFIEQPAEYIKTIADFLLKDLQPEH